MAVSTRCIPFRSLRIAIALLTLLTASSAFAQEATPAPEAPGDTVDFFGFTFSQNERFKFGGELVMGWSHDGAQAALGFEKQGRVGMAILSVAGKVSDHVRYYVSVNPVSETNSRPACGEPDFFFPNDPELYAGLGPTVKCDVEDGLKRVDTYNTSSLDYITQQGILREGYIDWGISGNVSLRGGRFILPIGFAPREVGANTAKDMTRITRLNAEANFGAMLAVTARRGDRAVFDAGVMAVLGDGNREKDYDWFYFVNTSYDTNSAITVVASARLTPIKAIDVRAAYKKGYTGSKVERLPSYWASKRNDDALVVSVKLAPTSWASVFGEYARYKWGPTVTSGELVGIPDLLAIDKPGYFVGAQLEAPITGQVRIGASAVREELTRDDSMIQYLTLNRLYGVSMGKKDRQLVVRGFVDVNRLVNVSFFWMDVSNPFPWVSASWPVAGPVAFTGREPDRIGVTVTGAYAVIGIKVLLIVAAVMVTQSAPPPLRLLFIGNSLTYANDLPGMITLMARSVGRQVLCETVARPDFGLQQHWNRGDARKAIAEARWDIVVLQQGPSAQRESRTVLVNYTKRFDEEIKKAGARTALYMVWPSKQRRADFEGVGQSYRAAAEAVGAILIPAGDAWRAVLAADSNAPLYAEDGLHPSGTGTYLAALVVYRQLVGVAPPMTPVLGGSLDHAGLLHKAAAQVAPSPQ